MPTRFPEHQECVKGIGRDNQRLISPSSFPPSLPGSPLPECSALPVPRVVGLTQAVVLRVLDLNLVAPV